VGTLWLAEDALWLSLVEPAPQHEGLEPAAQGDMSPAPGRLGRDVPALPGTGVHLKLTFPGANPHPRLEPLGRQESYANYFLGNDRGRWRSRVPVWSGVRYVDLYPGVDLVVGEGAAAGAALPWRLEVSGGAPLLFLPMAAK
jgi:hypothetical protein